MKILIVNDYEEKIGGAETYINSLKTHLEGRGHIVEIFSGSRDFKKSVDDRKNLRSYLNRIFSISQYFKFKKKLSAFSPDVIHLQNIFNEVSPSILLLKKNIPVVMTIHDYHLVQAVFTPEERTGNKCDKEICPGCLNCVGLKGMIFEKIKRTVHYSLLKNVDLFIAPSKYMEKIILENSDYRPKLIYYGIDLANASEITTRWTGLFSGRLTKGKGVDLLIESVRGILNEIPKFKLLIAGDGELKNSLISRVNELKLADKVTFLGYLSKKEMLNCYHRSTFLVVPSTWAETFGLVCVEALSMGRPVIASNVGGIPEIVQDGFNGYLFEVNNSKELTKNVVKLLKDSSVLERFSMNAHESIKKFDINRHIDEIIASYKKTEAEVHRV